MNYDNDYHPNEPNDIDKLDWKKSVDEMKTYDKGYNKIYKFVETNDEIKKKKIEFYTSNGIGSRIRDAETGQYYNHCVGSAYEDLYFKTVFATGECKSKNGSSTLFYTSPQHYMSHFGVHLNSSTIEKWEEKSKKRENTIKNIQKEKERRHCEILE
jgi:hypothetical protein